MRRRSRRDRARAGSSRSGSQELADAAMPISDDGDARIADRRHACSRISRSARARICAKPTPRAATDNPNPAAAQPSRRAAEPAASRHAPVPTVVDGVDKIEGEKLTLLYDGKKCIHSRCCVTWAPNVFLANVKGPWIHPDAMDVERLAEIAHVVSVGGHPLSAQGRQTGRSCRRSSI